MSFTPEQRYKGGMTMRERDRELRRETGRGWYSRISKGRPPRPRFHRPQEEAAARPAAVVSEGRFER